MREREDVTVTRRWTGFRVPRGGIKVRRENIEREQRVIKGKEDVVKVTMIEKEY